MNYDLKTLKTSDLDYLTMTEVSDLITKIYNQLDRTGYNHKRDAKLIDLLIDLESQYNDDQDLPCNPAAYHDYYSVNKK